MDEQTHRGHIDSVRDWFGRRQGRPVSVEVVTPAMSGADETRVHKVLGPLAAIEEHPAHPGVFRAVFDGSADPAADGAAPWVGLGYEVVDVSAGPDSLIVVSGGGQRIEIRDPVAQAAAPSADEVEWATPAFLPPAPPAPPAPPVAPPAPPAPPVAPPPAPPVAPPAPPAPPVAPPPQPPASSVAAVGAPVPAPVAPAPGYAPAGTEFHVKAPVYSNALQSNFFGDATIRVDGDRISVTAARSSSRSGGMVMVGGVLLLVLSIIGLAIGFTAGTYDNDFSNPITMAVLGVSGAVFLLSIAMYFIGRGNAAQGDLETVTFLKAQARGRKVSYDTNLGCLLSLPLTPVIGIIVMFAMGRRIVKMSAPIGPAGEKRILVLRARSAADGAMLNAALRG